MSRNSARGLASRPLVNLAIVVLIAGCAGNASPTPTVPSTPGRTATAAVTATATATPAASAPSGQMTHGRSFHTATLLVDGRLLVAGGYFNRSPIAAADLYDPTTDTFAATGSMAVARGFATATRLADGRVLFVGGDPGQWNFDGPYLASAELYDPRTGTFSPTGSMGKARNLQTATLLLDGRVLIAGGNDRGQHSLDSAELYDPTTGTFTATGRMTVGRTFHTATLLADGRVLLTGGTSDGWVGDQFLVSAEIYDPTTGAFTAIGPMVERRGSHTATLLADGRVLIAGGTSNGGVSLASVELFDPGARTFAATGSMADARTYHAATLLADGTVLLSGGDPAGWGYDGPFLASAEIFDAKTGLFRATGPMTDTLTNHSATLLAGGRVLIAGGYDGRADVTSAELYDPLTGTFTLLGPRG